MTYDALGMAGSVLAVRDSSRPYDAPGVAKRVNDEEATLGAREVGSGS